MHRAQDSGMIVLNCAKCMLLRCETCCSFYGSAFPGLEVSCERIMYKCSGFYNMGFVVRIYWCLCEISTCHPLTISCATHDSAFGLCGRPPRGFGCS